MVDITPKPLPPEAEALPSRRQWLLWLAMNRQRIGLGLLALFAFLRIVLHFEGHNELIDFLKTIVDLFLIGSAATTSAGAFKSDDYHEDRAREEGLRASGSWPPARRSSDR